MNMVDICNRCSLLESTLNNTIWCCSLVALIANFISKIRRHFKIHSEDSWIRIFWFIWKIRLLNPWSSLWRRDPSTQHRRFPIRQSSIEIKPVSQKLNFHDVVGNCRRWLLQRCWGKCRCSVVCCSWWCDWPTDVKCCKLSCWDEPLVWTNGIWPLSQHRVATRVRFH